MSSLIFPVFLIGCLNLPFLVSATTHKNVATLKIKIELVAYLKGRSEAASIPAKEKKARVEISILLT
jgi:hypothetical protein